MFWLFFFHLMLDGVIGVVVWLALRRVQAHMKASPEASRLIAEHVIAPILSGAEVKIDAAVKKTKGTLV